MAAVKVERRRTSSPEGVSLHLMCDECRYQMFTWVPVDVEHPEELLADHLRQHGEGRALDIEVDWEVSARCSVCPDGGNVRLSDDSLVCDGCDTTWDLEGKFGERNEG